MTDGTPNYEASTGMRMYDACCLSRCSLLGSAQATPQPRAQPFAHGSPFRVLFRRCCRQQPMVYRFTSSILRSCVRSLILRPACGIAQTLSPAPARPLPYLAALARTFFTTPAAQMPTVGVNRDKLFEKLGRVYSKCRRPRAYAEAAARLYVAHNQTHLQTRLSMEILALYSSLWAGNAADEEFDHLCFEYGIELDDVVSGELRDGALGRARMWLVCHAFPLLYGQGGGPRGSAAPPCPLPDPSHSRHGTPGTCTSPGCAVSQVARVTQMDTMAKRRTSVSIRANVHMLALDCFPHPPRSLPLTPSTSHLQCPAGTCL